MADLGCLHGDFIQGMADFVGHLDIRTGQGRAPLVYCPRADQGRGNSGPIPDPGQCEGPRRGAEALSSGAETVDHRASPRGAVKMQACGVTLAGTA